MENVILTNIHTYHRWYWCYKNSTKIGGVNLGALALPGGRGGRTILAIVIRANTAWPYEILSVWTSSLL